MTERARTRGERPAGGGLATVAVVVAAVACCAGPLIVGAVGGIAVGRLLGVAAGVVAIVAVAAVVAVRHRGRGRARARGETPPLVEVLYLDGCPGYERLLPRVRDAAERAGAELRLRRVETPAAAEAERFLGSPTVRVEGRDVEAGAAARTDYGLKCRLYGSGSGTAHVPPEQWIREALGPARG